jgi:hypothetical protein
VRLRNKKVMVYPLVKAREPRSWEEGCPIEVKWKGDFFGVW